MGKVSSPTPMSPISLLDKLHDLKLSDISRKRKVCTNPPPVGKRRSKRRCQCDPKSVTPSQRLREFSQKPFTTSRGKLFCRACREDLSLKLSVMTNHIKSLKHNQGKENPKVNEACEKDIAEEIKKHNTATHPEGETLPMDQLVYRIKVVTSFLRAGVPLNKFRQFRDVLQENAFRLTDRSHMANLVPFMWKEEQQLIKSKIKGRELSVVFDGTTCLGEAVVILVHYVTEHMEIQQ